jgi:hypothetical protein
MNFPELQQALAIKSGAVLIAPGTLTANIDALVTSSYDGQPIAITQVIPGPGDGVGETVVLQGKSTFLNVADLTVNAFFRLDSDGNAQALLRYTLLNGQPATDGWRFSKSFPNLPSVVDWNKTFEDPTTLPLDDLALSNASYVVVSEDRQDPVFNIGLTSGINFVGNLAPSGPVATITTLFGGGSLLTIYGVIRLPAGDSTITQLEPAQYPWTLAGGAPGILLQADLGLSHSFQSMQFEEIFFRIYTPLSRDWLEKNPAFQPVLAYTGTLVIPSASIRADVAAPFDIGGAELLLVGAFEGISLGKLVSLVDLAGSNDLLAEMPDQLNAAGTVLGKLQITHASLAVSLDPSTGFQITSTSVTVGMPDLNWHVWDDHFEIDSISCQFEVDSPFDSANRQFIVTLYGTFQIESIPIAVSASNRDQFTVYAALETAQTIPLKQLMQTYVPGVPAPGDLTVDSLAVAVAPGKSYSMALAMAQQPTPWTINLGPTTLTISDVLLAFSYPKGGPAAGAFAGTIALGSVATLTMNCAIPGETVLEARLPSINLTDLAREIANVTSLPQPSGFPELELQNSDVRFTAGTVNGATAYDFRLSTQVAIGSATDFNLSAVIIRSGDATGFAAGIWTPTWAAGAGWSPGSLWKPLSALEIDSAGLILSTLAPSQAQKGQIIPLAAVPALAPANFQIAAGVTFFASLSLQTGSVAILKEVFGDDTKFSLFASFDPGTSATTLIAHLGSNYTKSAFTFEGFDLSWESSATASASISLSATGAVALDSNDTLTFSVSGQVATDGTARLALDVQNWVHPFGYQRLTVEDFGIAIALADAVVLSLQGTFDFTTSAGKTFTFAIAGAIADFEAPSALAFSLASDSPDQPLKISEIIEGITTIDISSPEALLLPWVLEIQVLDLFLAIQELSFWVVLLDQVEMAGITYKKGFGFRGDISLFGRSVKLYVEVQEAQQMFAGSAELPEALELGSVLVLSRPPSLPIDSQSGLAIAPGDPPSPQGPILSVSTVIDATHQYYLFVAAHVEFLDVITADLVGEASNDGIKYEYQLSVGSSGGAAWAAQKVEVQVSREKLSFSAGLSYDIGWNNITLGGFDLFGEIPIPSISLPDFHAGISGTVGASASPAQFQFGGSLTFAFMGLNLDPSFSVTVDLASAPQKLADFAGLVLTWIEDHLADLLKDFFNVVEKFVSWLKDNFEQFKDLAENVARVLKDEFNVLTSDAAHALMTGIGYAEDAIDTALDAIYSCAMSTALGHI